MIKIFVVDDRVLVGEKTFSLNLNDYKGTNVKFLNKAKIIFKNNLYAAYPEIKKLKFKRLKVSYSITPHSRVLFDTMNVVSIVDKFFLDAIVEAGCLPDDNYNYVSYGHIETSQPEISKTDKNKKIVILCEFE